LNLGRPLVPDNPSAFVPAKGKKSIIAEIIDNDNFLILHIMVKTESLHREINLGKVIIAG
jgi:hypothetical protein